jgi:hypothetical protein
MQSKNRNTALIYALGAAVIIAIFEATKNPAPKNNDPLKISETDIKDALRIIQQKFGTKIAQQVEQVYRIETGNFTSGQFLASRSAGMVAFKDTFPYGWIKFIDLWQSTPKSAPVGLTRPFTVKGKDYKYIIFPSMLAAMLPLAAVIAKGGTGAWGGSAGYAQAVSTMTPKIVNSFS